MVDTLLETAASQFLESYGALALPLLRRRADGAEERGHLVTAKVLREIAAAAAERAMRGSSRE